MEDRAPEHFGDFLFDRMAATGESGVEFARRAGVSYQTLHRLFRMPLIHPKGSRSLKRIAGALGMTWLDFHAAWRNARSVPKAQRRASPLVRLERRKLDLPVQLVEAIEAGATARGMGLIEYLWKVAAIQGMVIHVGRDGTVEVAASPEPVPPRHAPARRRSRKASK